MRHILSILLITAFMIVLTSCGTRDKNAGPINLTSSSKFFDGYPDWSPYEEKLAFVSFQENN